MRAFYAAAVAALVCSAPAAQSQYADSTGGYLALHTLSPATSTAATIGYRFSGGRDAGFTLGYESFGSRGDRLAIGPVVGVSRPLGRGFAGRIEGTFRYESTTSNIETIYGAGDDVVMRGRYTDRGFRQDVTASASRAVRLVGSVRLRPTLGVFATSRQRLSLEASDQTDFLPDGFAGSAGLHVELPLTFRLFRQDAAVAPAVRFPLAGDFGLGFSGEGYAGGGLRLNF